MNWNEQVATLRNSLKQLQTKLKRDKITGMGRENARQLVSTKGISVPPSAFQRLFDEAIADLPFFYA